MYLGCLEKATKNYRKHSTKTAPFNFPTKKPANSSLGGAF